MPDEHYSGQHKVVEGGRPRNTWRRGVESEIGDSRSPKYSWRRWRQQLKTELDGKQ